MSSRSPSVCGAPLPIFSAPKSSPSTDWRASCVCIGCALLAVPAEGVDGGCVGREESGAPNFQKGGRDDVDFEGESRLQPPHFSWEGLAGGDLWRPSRSSTRTSCTRTEPVCYRLKVVGCPPWAESGTARSHPGATARRSSQFRGMPVRATAVTPACIAAVSTRACTPAPLAHQRGTAGVTP